MELSKLSSLSSLAPVAASSSVASPFGVAVVDPSCSLINEVSEGRSLVPRNLRDSELPSLKNFKLKRRNFEFILSCFKIKIEYDNRQVGLLLGDDSDFE